MSSWSWRVKFCGLKLSIEVHYPTALVSANLKKMLYSCLCEFCYCILMEKINENDSFVTIIHVSHLSVGSEFRRCGLADHCWKTQYKFLQQIQVVLLRRYICTRWSCRYEGCHTQVEASPIFFGHVRVNQWSDFFGRGPIFSGHRSWNVWWWFCKLCWAHDTYFSLFLMSSDSHYKNYF